MSTFAQYATGSLLAFAALFNAQLTYNADMFNNKPAQFDARLTEMHTVTQQGKVVVFTEAKNRNKIELSKLFRAIR